MYVVCYQWKLNWSSAQHERKQFIMEWVLPWWPLPFFSSSMIVSFFISRSTFIFFGAKMACLKEEKLSMLIFSDSARDIIYWKCEVSFSPVIERMSRYFNYFHDINHHHQSILAEISAPSCKRRLCFVKSLAYPCKTLSIHAWMQCNLLAPHPFTFWRTMLSKNTSWINQKRWTLRDWLPKLFRSGF